MQCSGLHLDFFKGEGAKQKSLKIFGGRFIYTRNPFGPHGLLFTLIILFIVFVFTLHDVFMISTTNFQGGAGGETMAKGSWANLPPLPNDTPVVCNCVQYDAADTHLGVHAMFEARLSCLGVDLMLYGR